MQPKSNLTVAHPVLHVMVVITGFLNVMVMLVFALTVL